MPTTVTTIGRLPVDFPDLGHDGGALLESRVKGAWEKWANAINSRFFAIETLTASGGSTNFTHNFNTDFAELRVIKYRLVNPTTLELERLTELTTPKASEVAVIAQSGSEKLGITLTNNSVSDADLALVVVHGRGAEKLDDLDDVDLATAAPEDGQALVYNGTASKFVPGASGDSSFKLQSLVANVATFKAGAINLQDGKQLNLAADLDINLKTEVNDAGVTSPAGTTRYYIYLDLTTLPSQTAVGDADRLVYEMGKGTGGNFVVLAESPENVDQARYVHLAVVKTDATPDYLDFENLAFREHQYPLGAASTLVETVLSERSIGTVGAKDNAYGALVDADFPNTTTLHYYHLDNGDGVDEGPGSATLTVNGTPTENVKGFYAREDLFRFPESTSVYLNANNADFGITVGTNAVAAGGWFKMDDWRELTDHTLFSFGDVTNQFFVKKDNSPGFDVSIPGGNGFGGAPDVPTDWVDGSWHHIALTVSAAGVTAFYLDGQLVASGTTASTVTTGNDLEIARRVNGGIQPFKGSVQDFFFHKGTDYSSAQVNALYSKRFAGQQIAAGHVLDADSWPCTSLTDRIYFWNLNDAGGAASDGSGNAKSLTNVGSVTNSGLDIVGESTAPEFDGSTQYYQSTDAAFDPGNSSFMFGGWFSMNDWSANGVLISQWNVGASERQFRIDRNSGSTRLFFSSDGTANSNLAVAQDFVNGSWHHILGLWDAPSQTGYLYVDGELSGQLDYAFDLFTPVTSRAFNINGRDSGNELYAGRSDECLFALGSYSSDDIRKLYAARLDLAAQSQQVTIPQRQWYAQLLDENGYQSSDLDQSWLLDQRASKIYVDFGQDPVGGKINLRLNDGGVGAVTVPVKKFDKTYSADPSGTIAHGLPDVPTAFAIIHDELADGQWAPLDPSSYIKADATNLYVSGLGALTIDATHKLRIVAQVGVAALSQATGDNSKLVPTTSAISAAGYTAKNGDHVLADMTSGAYSMTLPATPSVGDRVTIYDVTPNPANGFNVNNLTAGRNGELVEGTAGDFVATVTGDKIELLFVGGTVGWKYY